MTKTPRKTYSAADLARAASDAAAGGNAALAQALFSDAIALDRRNPDLLIGRSGAALLAGDAGQAAADLCLALRLRPQEIRAARQLSTLAANVEIENPQSLDEAGLAAAFAHETIALQPIAELAMARVFATDQALASAGRPQSAVGEQAMVARSAKSLANALLHLALRHGVVRDERQERALSRVRAELIGAGPDALLGRPEVFEFAIALATQMVNNDHAWFVSEPERDALAKLAIDRDRLISGDAHAGAALLLALLYRPLEAVFDRPLAIADAERIRPRSLKSMIVSRVTEAAELARLGGSIPDLAPIADPTSKRVAGQYDRAPYPRWTSLQVPAAGGLRRALARYVPAERLGFMDQPFEVLIAGTGTGQQLVRSTHGYGENARITGIDLARTSLAYAARKCRQHGLERVELLRGDILDLGQLDRKFDVVECVGVLHHMADPVAGLRMLVDRLKPGGLLYVGLYSELARTEIAEARRRADYPGAGCDDEAARRFRRTILDLPETEPVAMLKRSRNFYALAEFRDLTLHECEHRFTIPKLSTVLAENDLSFAGFTLPETTLRAFAERHRDAPWPGRLVDWAHFEAENPRTFDAMYCFWCTRS